MGLINKRALRSELDIFIYVDGIVIKTYTCKPRQDSKIRIPFKPHEREIVEEYIRNYMEENKKKIEINLTTYETLGIVFDV